MTPRSQRWMLSDAARSRTTSRGDMANQTPRAEMQERLAEGIPGLGMAAWAVGLESHRQLLADARRRTADSHAAQMRAAKQPPTRSDDEMGDIVICGDINATDPKRVLDSLRGRSEQPSPQPQPPAPTATGEPGKTSLMKQALPWLLSAALGSGVGGYALSKYLTPAANQAAAAVEGNVYDIQPWSPPATADGVTK